MDCVRQVVDEPVRVCFNCEFQFGFAEIHADQYYCLTARGMSFRVQVALCERAKSKVCLLFGCVVD